jgi:cytochrome c556
MRWFAFIFLQILLIGLVAAAIYMHKDRAIILKKPPASLAQWYKPQNKRQVWLHNMFKLRREMQAAKHYADQNDAQHLEKWVASFSEHYLKIGEMVPEWKKKMNVEAISSLQQSVIEHRFKGVSSALDEINKSCKSCHADFRAVTANMYRAPDFSPIKINAETTFETHMEKLTRQVNQIKIASEDGLKDVALSSLSDLTQGMHTLGKTCINCHKKDVRIYPNDSINKTISNLEQSLQTGTLKDQGRDLGTLAVLACARCHGTHRIAYGIRKTFTDQPNWMEFIRH